MGSEMCIRDSGLGKVVDKEKYGHLSPADLEVLRWVIRQGASASWLPDSPRTSARGFLHRLVTRGPPVRMPLHRLSRETAEKMAVPAASCT